MEKSETDFHVTSTHKYKKYYRRDCKVCYKVTRKLIIARRASIWKENARKASKTPAGRYKWYKKNSARYGRIFELSLDEFLRILEDKCFYCSLDGYGIDRKNNEIGYTISNCVSCCTKCNMMKTNLSEADFIGHCKKIAASH